MNPDPNQPQDPAAAPAPESIVDTPTPTVEQAPATETPVAPTEPVVEQPPVVSNPFAAAQDAPVAPAAAAPVSTPPIGSAAPAPGKSKKKLVILLSSIIGGLIVLGGAAFAVYAMFFMVTKADYEAARDQLIVVKDVATDTTGVSPDSEVTLDTMLAKVKELKTEHEKLASMRALTVDKDLKTVYDAYAVKANAAIAYQEAYAPSIFALYSAQQEAASSASLYTTAGLEKAINALNNAEITEPTIKTYVDKQIALYESLLADTKVNESATATSTEKLAALSRLSRAISDFAETTRTFSKEMQAKAEEVSYVDELNDLGKAITAKLNDL